MFQFWLNTRFIDGNYLCFEKAVIDKACKDKKNKLFQASFKVELFLDKISDNDADYKVTGLDDNVGAAGVKDDMGSDDDDGDM